MAIPNATPPIRSGAARRDLHWYPFSREGRQLCIARLCTAHALSPQSTGVRTIALSIDLLWQQAPALLWNGSVLETYESRGCAACCFENRNDERLYFRYQPPGEA